MRTLCKQLDPGRGWHSGSSSTDFGAKVSNTLLIPLLASLQENLLRQMIGTNDIKATSAADGNSPSIAPLMTSGKSLINPRKGMILARYEILEMVPTMAAGNDQKITRAARPPCTANLRIIRCHQLRLIADHTTSCGETPIKRGVIWKG